MKVRRAVVSLGVITVLYLSVLIWADSKKNLLELLPSISDVLPVLLTMSMMSYLLRYFRWHWLLSRNGHKVSFLYGFLAYLAGFSFTATPGKVGELVRIRYFLPMGVPHYRVVSTFIFERVFDLVAVLMLASLAITQFGHFLYAATFVALSISIVLTAAKKPGWIGAVVAHLRVRRMSRLSRWLRVIRDGLSGINVWFNRLDISVALILGLLAWGVISAAFIILLGALGVDIPVTTAMAIYPLSMLIGAASMLPGGVGTTEAAIVIILSYLDVPLDVALIAAIGIRLVTLWFSIVCGFISMIILERKLKHAL